MASGPETIVYIVDVYTSDFHCKLIHRHRDFKRNPVCSKMSQISSENKNVSTGQHPSGNPTADESSANGAQEERNNGTSVTVSDYLTVKHPLMYRWSLWYCKQDKSRAWEDCMKEVASFNTVEDFWALYNHIQLATGLPFFSDYYLFKDGIQPMWEDERNRQGGRWLVQIEKSRRDEVLDCWWLEILMAMIGEQFEECSSYICGAVVNVRQKGDKISLWTKDAIKDDVNRKIGLILKKKLGLKTTIAYEVHSDVSQKVHSTVKAQLKCFDLIYHLALSRSLANHDGNDLSYTSQKFLILSGSAAYFPMVRHENRKKKKIYAKEKSEIYMHILFYYVARLQIIQKEDWQPAVQVYKHYCTS